MNKEKLVKIINKELTTLTEIVSDFSADGIIESFEIDMALSKIKDIQHVLLMLQNLGTEVKLPQKEQAKAIWQEESLMKAESSRIKPNGPVIAPKKEVVQGSVPEPKDTVYEPQPIEAELPKSKVIVEEKGSFTAAITASEKPTGLEKEKTIEILKEVPQVSEDLEPKIHEDVQKPGEITQQNEAEEKVTTVQTEIPSLGKKQKSRDIENPRGNSGVIVADKFMNQAASVNDMLAGIKKNKDLASVIKERPIRNLKSAIKLNDRIWFTNELFNKDATLFEKTVEAINHSSSLDEALAHLFSNFNWDQNQKSTIGFLELVIRRFANK